MGLRRVNKVKTIQEINTIWRERIPEGYIWSRIDDNLFAFVSFRYDYNKWQEINTISEIPESVISKHLETKFEIIEDERGTPTILCENHAMDRALNWKELDEIANSWPFLYPFPSNDMSFDSWSEEKINIENAEKIRTINKTEIVWHIIPEWEIWQRIDDETFIFWSYRYNYIHKTKIEDSIEVLESQIKKWLWSIFEIVTEEDLPFFVDDNWDEINEWDIVDVRELWNPEWEDQQIFLYKDKNKNYICTPNIENYQKWFNNYNLRLWRSIIKNIKFNR